jgi:8-oxo-dGTP diphosphatase
LKAACLDQFRTYGDPHRDPRGRIVTVAYLAAVRADSTARRGGQAAPFGGQAAPFGGQARAASDAAEVRWHDPASPPRMAFDHQTILRDSLAELRRRARYAAMLLAFLPSTFTIAQLKECAEEVMGQPISSRALSRRLRRLHILRRTASRGKYRTVPHAWEIIERCGGLLGESLPRQKTTS